MTEERIPAKAEQHLLSKIRSSRETQQSSGSHPGCTSHSSRGLLKVWSLVLTLRDSHSIGVVWNPSLGMMLKPSRWLWKLSGEGSHRCRPLRQQGSEEDPGAGALLWMLTWPPVRGSEWLCTQCRTGEEETFSSTPLGSVTGPCKLDDKNGH